MCIFADKMHFTMLLDKLFQSVEQSFEKAGEAVSGAAEEAFGHAQDIMDKAQETQDKAQAPLTPEEEKAIDEKMEQEFNEAETKGRDAMHELMDQLKVRFLNHLG